MNITFSTLLEALQQNSISYSKSNIDDMISYIGSGNLISNQDAYSPHYIYIGPYSFFNQNLPYHKCGFVFYSSEDCAPPSDCEYVFTNEKLVPTIKKILSNIFYSTSMLIGSDSLVASLLEGKGLKYLVDVYSDILENPVFLCDPLTFDWVIYPSRYEIPAPDIKALLSYGDIPSSYRDAIVSIEHEKRLRESHQPLFLDAGSYSAMPRIVQGINISDQLIAAISVIQSNRPFTNKDYEIVQFLSTVLTDEIRKKGTPASALYEYRLQSMIKGEPIPDNFLPPWLSNSKNNPSNHFRICVIQSEDMERYQLESMFRRRYHDTKFYEVTRIKENVIIFINISEKSERAFLSELDKYMTGTKMHGAVSASFTSLESIALHYNFVCKALSAGMIMMPENALYNYEDISICCLLHTAAQSSKLEPFVSPQITLLKNYDEQFGTDYYKTLQTYLTAGKKSSTIEILNIHKNTLNYRLEKITEIANIDLNDGLIRFKLLLSIFIEQYLEKKVQDKTSPEPALE